MPEHFEIVQLPQEIVSWLTALLLRLPVKEQLRKRRSRTKDRAWQRWVEYAKSSGITDNFYLDRLTRPNRNKLMGAFAMAMGDGRFSREAYDTLAESTIRSTISYVSLSFRDNDRPNPTKDEDGELS
jgi:hypothetical protein